MYLLKRIMSTTPSTKLPSNHRYMSAASKTKEKEKCHSQKVVRRVPISNRRELKNARRVVVKFGSSVIIDHNHKIHLSRLSGIIEQMAALHNQGKDLIFVTSGSVAHGRALIQHNTNVEFKTIDKKAAASVGQPSLMYMYNALFSKHDIQVTQVLVSETELYNDANRHVLREVLNNVLKMRMLPIMNTNDSVLSSPETPCPTLCKSIKLRDNDTLAALIAGEMDADVLLILSTIDGVYDKSPKDAEAKMLSTFSRKDKAKIEFGDPSSVGIGGMATKIDAALYAVDKGVAVVVANGTKISSIENVMSGKKIGTLFLPEDYCEEDQTEEIAKTARQGNYGLRQATPAERSSCIHKYAELLDANVPRIVDANMRDLDIAKKIGLSAVLQERLQLTPEKIKALSVGLRMVADSSKTILGRVVRKTLLADGLELTQITVPIGVILVIFESRPDVFPQIAALAIASGNGLVLKGGDEAVYSNQILKELVDEALRTIKCEGAVGLVSTKEEIADLINMEKYIDLIIPRGGYQLVRFIQDNAKRIPVMGHSEGVCHIYVDKHCDREKTHKIIKDAKTDYPSACNAVETILLHKDLMEGDFFAELCCRMKHLNIKINSGPNLTKFLQFGPPLVRSMKKEYGATELCIEVVDDLEAAVRHIHTYGSGHTESIITEDKGVAEQFLRKVDSACVFHNASTRMSDGFRFGLGAEVGISTARIHARGPVGIEGLLTTKWILRSQCAHTASEFNQEGGPKWIHKSLPIPEMT